MTNTGLIVGLVSFGLAVAFAGALRIFGDDWFYGRTDRRQ